jgi:hypothetical protein
MNRLTTVVLGSFALGVGIWVLAGSSRADDEEDARLARDARNAVEKLIDKMNKGGTGKDQAREIREKFTELKPIMLAGFKPPPGGTRPGDGDAIEARIIKWSNAAKPMAPAELDKQKAALQRAAEVARSMAEVAALYPRKKPADTAKWKRYNDDMRKAADDLAKAVKASDPKAVHKAVTDIYGSCTDCHSDFRDTGE